MDRDHLDAFAGRNVVYCHQCRHEWYEDDFGLEHCPRCQSGAIEIVTPESDPRNIMDRHDHAHHDDPDEDDIDEFMSRPPGSASYFERTYGRPSPFDHPGEPRRPVNPNNDVDILSRFTDMLMNDLGAGARPQVGRSGPESLFPTPMHNPHADGEPFVRRSNMNMTFSRTVARDGSTSVIIASSPARGGPGNRGPPMDFNQTFEQLINGLRPPTHGMQPAPQPGGVPETLHQLLFSMLRPSSAFGDAVFSQQALDRVISDLMEANPQSNAAPPATQSAIDRLERKKADGKMLDPDGKGEAKGECTICISDVVVGDEVVCLPCKHWFHEECVVMWLREHNTCPVCRMAIEGDSNGRGNSRSRGGSHPSIPSNPNGPGGNSNSPGNVGPGASSSAFNPWGGSSPNQPRNRSNNPFDAFSGNPFLNSSPDSRQTSSRNPFNFSGPVPPTQPQAPTPPSMLTRSPFDFQPSSGSSSLHQDSYHSQQNRDRNAERLPNPDPEPSGENISQRRSRSPRSMGREVEEGTSRPWRVGLSLRGDRRSSSGRDGRRENEEQQGQGSRGFLGRIGDSLQWGSRHERERRS